MANKMKKTRAIAMPFNWLFALIVGGVILFLAIYSATQIITTGEQSLYTESAAKLISLLDPFETGLASGKSAQINFQKLTRTFYECDEISNRPFGRQQISFSEQTIGNKFGDVGGAITVKNKYVFTENMLEGKNLYVFSKPVFMPFKVADSIMITSGKYCFYQAPEEIRNEVLTLNLKNIIFAENLVNCTESDSISVCWGGVDCDIKINENRVVKGNEQLYYTEDLIYAAIFSSPENYECNVKRIKARFNELALIYIDKLGVIQQSGCGTQISMDLEIIRNKKIESSRDFVALLDDFERLESINLAAKTGCSLW